MIDYIRDHYDDIVAIWAQIVLLASLIIRVIPPLPADHWALPIVKFLGKVIALNTGSPSKRPQ